MWKQRDEPCTKVSSSILFLGFSKQKDDKTNSRPKNIPSVLLQYITEHSVAKIVNVTRIFLTLKLNSTIILRGLKAKAAAIP